MSKFWSSVVQGDRSIVKTFSLLHFPSFVSEQIWVFWKLLLCLKNTTTIRRFRVCLFLLSFCGRWKEHFSGNRSKASRYSWVLCRPKLWRASQLSSFCFPCPSIGAWSCCWELFFRGNFFPWKSNRAVFRLRFPVQGEEFRILRERLKVKKGCVTRSMKIQCDVCESTKATVICCADEAALCTDCDTKVHAANKLANKHQRVPLMAPTDAPRCDICQVCFLHGFLRNTLLVSCFRVVGAKTRSRVASFFWSVFSNSEHSMGG